MSIPIMFALKDVILKESAVSSLFLDRHAKFIQSYQMKTTDYEYVMSEHLRMSGVYWCLTAMDLMHSLDKMNLSEVIEFVISCYDEKTGGFGASVGYAPHLLFTLCAVQVLTLCDAVEKIDKEKVVQYVSGLQKDDGSFCGDHWGETDTRFSLCALACLALLDRLEAIDMDKTVNYIMKCQNFDGGFGTRPGSESHAGQIYCCLGALAIAKELHRIDADQLAWWLSERQCNSGGLNDRTTIWTENLSDSNEFCKHRSRRPEKLPDVCYSWWVLASLAILGRLHWVDKDALIKFIYACQDDEKGGFADRPDDMTDPFHTVFGLAGLSLLGETRLKAVNPVFCMPELSLEKAHLDIQLL